MSCNRRSEDRGNSGLLEVGVRFALKILMRYTEGKEGSSCCSASEEEYISQMTCDVAVAALAHTA